MYRKTGIWVSVLFGLLRFSLAQDTGTDVLKGKYGESSCDLKQQIYDGCGVKPFNTTYEKPASCTCNREFFNVMSACAYSTGNTLPVFNDWLTTCGASGISINQAQIMADSDSWKVSSPDWARLRVPENKTMDLQGAVILVQTGEKYKSPGWSTIQIILPIITALVAVLLTALFMTCCRRHLQHAQFSARVQKMIRPVPRVKAVDQHDSDAWEIEPVGRGYPFRGAGKTKDGEMYQFSDIPNTADPERDPGFIPPRTPYTDEIPFPKDNVTSPLTIQTGSTRSLPMGETHQRSGSSNSLTSIMKAMPWKKQAPKVLEVTPTRGFDINDMDHPTPSTRNSFGSGFGFSPEDVKSMDFHDGLKMTPQGERLDQDPIPPMPNIPPPRSNSTSSTRSKPAGVRAPPSTRRQRSNGSNQDDLYADPFSDSHRRGISTEDRQSFSPSDVLRPVRPITAGFR